MTTRPASVPVSEGAESARIVGLSNAATKPINEWPVRIGGLMRCCTETLRVEAGWATEGQVINCLYCSDSMRLSEGAWEWNRD